MVENSLDSYFLVNSASNLRKPEWILYVILVDVLGFQRKESLVPEDTETKSKMDKMYRELIQALKEEKCAERFHNEFRDQKGTVTNFSCLSSFSDLKEFRTLIETSENKGSIRIVFSVNEKIFAILQHNSDHRNFDHCILFKYELKNNNLILKFLNSKTCFMYEIFRGRKGEVFLEDEIFKCKENGKIFEYRSKALDKLFRNLNEGLSFRS